MMRRVSFTGILLVVLVVFAIAAAPQGGGGPREPLKVGDRLSQLIGKRFYGCRAGGSSFPFLNQGDRGPWELVRVGVDFAELESDSETLLVPLGAVIVKLDK